MNPKRACYCRLCLFRFALASGLDWRSTAQRAWAFILTWAHISKSIPRQHSAQNMLESHGFFPLKPRRLPCDPIACSPPFQEHRPPSPTPSPPIN